MRISCKGFDGADLQASVACAIVAMGNTEWYRASGIAVRTETVRPRGYAFTLRVATPDVTGAARPGGRRRSAYACWHAHRDVMLALFTLHPYATIATGVATYRGRDNFHEIFPRTGGDVVGRNDRTGRPVYRVDACWCHLADEQYGPTVQRTIDRLIQVRNPNQVP